MDVCAEGTFGDGGGGFDVENPDEESLDGGESIFFCEGFTLEVGEIE